MRCFSLVLAIIVLALGAQHFAVIPTAPTLSLSVPATAYTDEPVLIDGRLSTGICATPQTDGTPSITVDFGDGNTQELIAGGHAWRTAGGYTVTLTAKACNGDTAVTTDTISISDIPAATGLNVSDGANENLIDMTNAAGNAAYYVAPASYTNRVANAAKLQLALTRAAARATPEQEIVLPAGAEFSEIALPARAAVAKYLTIRSSNLALLPHLKRVAPSDAGNMPRIYAPSSTSWTTRAINTVSCEGFDKVNYYRLQGLHVLKDSTSVVQLMIQMPNNGGSLYGDWDGTKSLNSKIPHNFIFDRNFVDGGTEDNSFSHGGVAVFASYVSFVDNYLGEHKIETGVDTTALGINTGHGPYAVVNNAIIASSENFFFGGGGSALYNTATVSSPTTTTATLSNVTNLEIDQNIGFVSPALPSPGAPTVTPQGTTGATTYSYRIAALDVNGTTLAGTAGTTTTGNATLSGVNFNRITWTAVPNAWFYYIYGRTAGSEQTNLSTAYSYTNTFDDTGAFTPTTSPPGANTSGGNSVIMSTIVRSIVGNNITFDAIPVAPVNGSVADWAQVPSFLEFRQNHVFKPRRWFPEDPTWNGYTYQVKNLWETKVSRYTVVKRNVFENHWHGGQPFAIQISPRAINGTITYSAVVRHMEFSDNIVRNASHGMQISASDYAVGWPSQLLTDFTARNNLWWNIGNNWSAVSQNQFLALSDPYNVQMKRIFVIHNTTDFGDPASETTALSHLGSIGADAGALDAMWMNNIHQDGGYGFYSSLSGNSATNISMFFPGSNSTNWAKNYIGNTNGNTYPAWFLVEDGITWPNKFVGYAAGNFTLVAGHPGKAQATDGSDVGVNMTTLQTALGAPSLSLDSVWSTIKVISGDWRIQVGGAASVITGRVTLGGKVTVQ